MKQRLPVIDGLFGPVETYGHATTARGAMRVANRYFADPVVTAVKVEDSWLVLTEYGLEGFDPATHAKRDLKP